VKGQRRRAISTPGERRDEAARSPVVVAVSIAAHVLIVAVLVQLTFGRRSWIDALLAPSVPTPVERVGFLQLPRGEPPRESPRRGGNDQPESGPPAITPPVPVPPISVPNGLTPVPLRLPRTEAVIGTGPLVGGGGDTRGVRPSYTDPRIWAPMAPVVTAPLTTTERLDSTVAAQLQRFVDSARAANGGRDPADWTFRIRGQRVGIDQKYIRLGPVSIPTAALAFLPLNIQGNPTTIERDRRLAQMREEIVAQAARAARDDDFRAAVKALRERKQKERDDARKADSPPRIVPEGALADRPR